MRCGPPPALLPSCRWGRPLTRTLARAPAGAPRTTHHSEVDDALDFMKEEFSTRMEACDERQREFERKQAKMKDQVRPVLLLR